MNGKKVLITGAEGMLGTSLADYLTGFREIVAYSSELDITDFNKVNRVLNKENPDIIIHTAAFTDVELCESNIDQAYKVNTLGTQNLVNFCIGKNILFVYISSTGIYGTYKDKPYNEFDRVNPLSVHHKSKYEGEKIVHNHLSKYLILRTGWLYGGDKSHKKNFVYKRYLEAKDKEVIYSDDSQIGNPTFVGDFVKQIEVLIDNEQYGLYNCVNRAVNISRYDYVKKIIELFELRCKVEIAPKGMFKRLAPVSNNESAFNYKLELLNLNVMGDWEKSLSTYIKKLKCEI
jgi:dTDP-4-dehydrorhamnose reductase